MDEIIQVLFLTALGKLTLAGRALRSMAMHDGTSSRRRCILVSLTKQEVVSINTWKFMLPLILGYFKIKDYLNIFIPAYKSFLISIGVQSSLLYFPWTFFSSIVYSTEDCSLLSLIPLAALRMLTYYSIQVMLVHH